MADTQNEKLVGEKEEQRFHELNSKAVEERTPEETQELQTLKDNYAKSARDRIKVLNDKRKNAELRAEEERAEKERLKKELAELRKKPEPKPVIKEETVDVDGKKFFTDATLIAKVKAGEIEENDAYAHQRARDKAEIKADLREELKSANDKNSEKSIRDKDVQLVNEKYPYFNKRHPDFNPEDPVYKLANEIFNEGYAANPKGLSLAIKRAKEILRKTDAPIDRSNDLGVEDSDVPGENRSKNPKEVTLDEGEKETAVRMYCRGDAVNPATGRVYTEKEALAKALQAKKGRLR